MWVEPHAFTNSIVELWRRAEGPPSGAPYQYKKRLDFLKAIMASGIACGCVCMTVMTATVESRKMAAILQIIGWQRHAALVYCVLLWYRTFMLWSIDTYQNKVSADQYHVTILQAHSSLQLIEVTCFFMLTTDQVLVFNWIAGPCQANLSKTGQGCSEACSEAKD